jgi:Ca2+-transporting ATPase
VLHALAYRSRGPADAGAGRGVLPVVVAGTLGLQLAAMALPPLRGLLGLTPLGLADWALVGGAAALPFVVKELREGGSHGRTSHATSPA